MLNKNEVNTPAAEHADENSEIVSSVLSKDRTGKQVYSNRSNSSVDRDTMEN